MSLAVFAASHGWHNATPTDLVRLGHGYDRAGNRLWREDDVANTNSVDKDELYDYDGSYRLTKLERGDVNTTAKTISSKTFEEQWTLDQLGNWDTFKQDTDGDSSWDLNQSRGHNKANEITDIDSASTHVEHDAAGNMIRMTKPSSWSSHYHLEYDAWNRLVEVREDDDSTIVAQYAYDGQNYRIVKKTYVSGELDETRHYYYSQSWQCLEERLESGGTISSDPDTQYVWGLRYIVLPQLDIDRK